MAGRTARVENAVARLALVRRSAAEGTSAWNLRARSHVRATQSKDLDRDRRQRENWELKDDGRPDDPESKSENSWDEAAKEAKAEELDRLEEPGVHEVVPREEHSKTAADDDVIRD